MMSKTALYPFRVFSGLWPKSQCFFLPPLKPQQISLKTPLPFPQFSPSSPSLYALLNTAFRCDSTAGSCFFRLQNTNRKRDIKKIPFPLLLSLYTCVLCCKNPIFTIFFTIWGIIWDTHFVFFADGCCFCLKKGCFISVHCSFSYCFAGKSWGFSARLDSLVWELVKGGFLAKV